MDVLVTILVISVLVSIMTPTLSGVRETARQVVCRSNVRQIGLSLAMYSNDQGDRVPASVMAGGAAPWQTVFLRIDPAGSPPMGWDGLGHLYADDYLTAPGVFYCPSHRGEATYRNYAQAWTQAGTSIAGNFQYRGRGPTGSGRNTNILSAIAPGAALVSDSLRTQFDFNHAVGANVLRASLSVGWHEDRGALANILPVDVAAMTLEKMEQAWQSLDQNIKR